MKIAIANDHAGTELKMFLMENPGIESEITFINLGTDLESSVDYPDFAHPLADCVSSGKADLGILICGSGNGVAMAANKHTDIRAALCWLPELASLARQHNNANVLCIPSRFVSRETAVEIIQAFLKADFEGGRHQNRVSKINC